MTILDRTRKLLWARSGNQCAHCKCNLAVHASKLDSDSVVGDECHIISGRVNGPRYDPSIKCDIDGYENLILLCKTHHKMVDDQVNQYTVEKLRDLKRQHEERVQALLQFHPIEVDLVRRELCQSALKVLEKERSNFEWLRERKPYSNHLHQRAVEEYAFKIVFEEVKKLRRVSGYEQLSLAVLNEIKRNTALREKDVQNLLKDIGELIEKLSDE